MESVAISILQFVIIRYIISVNSKNDINYLDNKANEKNSKSVSDLLFSSDTDNK